MFSSLTRSTDPLTTSFDPNNAAHIALAMQELSEFKQARDKLLDIDTKITAGIALDTILWIPGLIGAMFALVGVAGLYYYATQQVSRKEHAHTFHEKLDRMMDIYHWMIKAKNASFTHNLTFQDVAEAIAPFVQRNELMPWDFTRTKPDDLSDRYIKLLAESPHRVQLVMVKDQGYLPFMATSAVLVDQDMESGLPLQERAIKKARNMCGLFEQSHAEAKLAIYGYKPKEVDAPRANAMQR